MGLRFDVSEPVWYLRSISYSDYTNSHHWLTLRDAVLQARGPSCQVCGFASIAERTPLPELNIYTVWGLVPVQVHHLTYAHLGDERDEDLLVACKPCNFAISRPQHRASQYWMSCPHGSRIPLPEKQARLRFLQWLERHQREDEPLDDVTAIFETFWEGRPISDVAPLFDGLAVSPRFPLPLSGFVD
jgi:hypothetical protein